MSRSTNIGIGTIVAIIGIIVAFLYYTGYFKHPSITYVTPYGSEEHCPETLNFYPDSNVDFALMYKNTGDDNTAVTVNVKSDEVSFEENAKSWLLEAGNPNPNSFTFKILNNQSLFKELNNFTIHYNYAYTDNYQYNKGKPYLSQDSSCSYNKTSKEGYDYSRIFKLIKK